MIQGLTESAKGSWKKGAVTSIVSWSLGLRNHQPKIRINKSYIYLDLSDRRLPFHGKNIITYSLPYNVKFDLKQQLFEILTGKLVS